MSMSQDMFRGEVIGNLISEPNLVEDDEGNKVCYCKIATNSKARRFDQKTGRELSPEERNKRRSFVELKITKTAAAEKFAKLFKEGDRAYLKGTLGTRRIQKPFWSEKEQRYITIKVDVDEDGKNSQEILEERQMMWVEDFSKIISLEGMNYLVYV